jgi:hypothetical protein
MAFNPKSAENLVSWKKGQSGNPGGRPKLAAHLRKRCREVVDADVVDAWAKEVKTQGPYWVRCSELLAAYGYGPPKAIADLDSEAAQVDPVDELSVEDLRALARQSLTEDAHEADADDDDDADDKEPH